MALLRWSIFLYLLNIYHCEDCVLDNGAPEIAWEFKLQNDLRCNYHANELPVKNINENITVTVKFTLKYFSFDSNEETLNMNTWVYLNWDDYRLKWNPKDYGGVSEIFTPASEIWTPDFNLLNGARVNEIPYKFYTACEIKSSGHVNCVLRILFYVSCHSKLSDWPYDTQSCKMLFGDSVARNTKVKYTLNDTHISMIGSEYGPGWDIIGYDQKENGNDRFQYLTFIFDIERQAKGLAAIVVVPSLVVSVLTVSSLFLDVRNGLRLGIVCFSLFNHQGLLLEINSDIPKHSVDIPTVLLFVRGSTILTLTVIILTLVLIYLIKRITSPPAYISLVNDFVYQSHIKYLIWPRWEADITEVKISEELNVKYVEDWIHFANIVNSVCLFVIVIAYIVMFGVYMPKPPHSMY